MENYINRARHENFIAIGGVSCLHYVQTLSFFSHNGPATSHDRSSRTSRFFAGGLSESTMVEARCGACLVAGLDARLVSLHSLKSASFTANRAGASVDTPTGLKVAKLKRSVRRD